MKKDWTPRAVSAAMAAITARLDEMGEQYGVTPQTPREDIPEEMLQLIDKQSLFIAIARSHPSIFQSMRCWRLIITGQGPKDFDLEEWRKAFDATNKDPAAVRACLEKYSGLASAVLEVLTLAGGETSDIGIREGQFYIAAMYTNAKMQAACEMINKKMRRAIESGMLQIVVYYSDIFDLEITDDEKDDDNADKEG